MVSSTVSSNYYFAKVRPPTHTHSTHPPKSKHQSELCGFSAVRSDHNRAAPAGGGGTSKIPSLCPGPLTTESKGRPACRTAAARLMTRCARGGGWDAVRCQIGRKLASPPCGTLMCVCVCLWRRRRGKHLSHLEPGQIVHQESERAFRWRPDRRHVREDLIGPISLCRLTVSCGAPCGGQCNMSCIHGPSPKEKKCRFRFFRSYTVETGCSRRFDRCKARCV